jgi:hypothetical protein
MEVNRKLFPGRLSEHTNYQRRRISLWIAALFIFAAAALVIFTLSVNKTIDIQPHSLGLYFDLSCIILTIAILIIMVFYYLKKRRFDIFEFPVWFTLNIYFQVILNIWLFQRDYQFSSPWLQTAPQEFALRTVLLIAGSLVIVWGVYFWGSRLFRRTEPQTIDPFRPRLRVMGAVWIVTWLINIIFTINGSQGYLSAQGNFAGANYLFFISMINNLVTFNLMIYHFKSPTNLGRVWLIVVCSSYLFLGLIIGTKGAIFIILYLIMSYYYARGRLPKTWLVVGVIVVLLVIPIVNTFRADLFANGYSRSSGASFADRLPILQKTMGDIFNHPISDLLAQTRTTFETRQAGVFEVTAAFLAVHPSVQPFVFVDFADSLATTLIPRFLWPGKPTTRPHLYNITTTYLGASQETSFAAVGQIGDAYRIGGVPFLFIWLVFITGLASRLYRAGPGSKSHPWTGFYLLVLTGMISYDTDVSSTLIRLLQFGIILYFLNKYVLFEQRKKRIN